MTSAWGRLGTMERISVGLPQLDTSPSATSTASLNNMASTSSHFQGNGYGTSSSSVRILFILGPLFCESMFDDNVARSYTPSLTVPSFWYHPHSIQPSYLRRFLSSVHFHRHSSYAVLLSSHHARTSSASYLGLQLRFLPLSVSRSCIFHSLSCRPL